MKKIKILYLILIFPAILFAQNIDITGTIIDEDANPLPGASILIEGSTVGASSDFDGNFNLSINGNTKTLVVSFIGYKTKKVSITDSKNYNIQLDVDSNNLDEVVVVGYGTQRKSDITGAVSSVEVDGTAAQQNRTVDQLLQGRVAGVQVTQNAGAPGSGVSVRIRGASRLRGNNEPLYVVDGIIISSAGEDASNPGGGNSLQESQNGLNGINPRDIESMEVLKDASATAIYGSRGANGVVLITTKKGKSGKSTINAYITTSVSEINKKVDVLNGYDYAKYRNESAVNDGNNAPYYLEDGQVYPLGTDDDGKRVISILPAKQVDWHDEIYRPGL